MPKLGSGIGVCERRGRTPALDFDFTGDNFPSAFDGTERTGVGGMWLDEGAESESQIAEAYRNDFDGAGWSLTNITVTETTDLAPNGATYSKIEATASAVTSLQTVAAAPDASDMPGTSRFRLYVKKGSGATDANKFRFRNATQGVDLCYVTIDFDTGALTNIGGTFFTVTATAEGVGEYVLECAAAAGHVADGDQVRVYPCFTGYSETAGEYAYVSTASVTFQRAQWKGFGPHNILPRGATPCAGSGWAATRCSGTANALPDYAGGMTASALLESSDLSTSHYSYYSALAKPTASSYRVTYSVDLQAIGRRYHGFMVRGASASHIVHSSIDFENGTLATVVATGDFSDPSGSIKDLGGGWYRVRISAMSDSHASLMVLHSLRDDSNSDNFDGDPAKGVASARGLLCLGGDQAWRVEFATNGAPYYGMRQPLDPRVGKRGVLGEPGRTGELYASADVTQAAWGNTRTSTPGTSIASVFDGLEAFKIVEDGTPAATHSWAQTRTVAADKACVWTGIFKKGERTRVHAYISSSGGSVQTTFDLDGIGAHNTTSTSYTGVSAEVREFGCAFVLCRIYFTMAGGATSVTVGHWLDNASGSAAASITYDGDGSSGLYVAYSNLEVDAEYPTEPIITPAGSTATRTADPRLVHTLDAALAARLGVEGTLFVNVAPLGVEAGNRWITYVSDGSTGNRYGIYIDPSGRIRAQVRAGAVTLVALTGPVVTPMQAYKVAFAFTASSAMLVVDGSLEDSGNPGALPSGLSTFTLNANDSGGEMAGALWHRSSTFDRALSQAEAEAITS